MKYVMLTHNKTGLKVPVFGSDHLSHDELGPKQDWTPTSAGFFTIPEMNCVGNSTSLGLRPAKGDAEICKCVVLGMESMLYLIQDTEQNKGQLEQIQQAKKLRSMKPPPSPKK